MSSGSFLLPLVLGIPLLGAIFVMCTPKAEATLHRGLGLAFSTVTFLVSLLVLRYFNVKDPGMQLVSLTLSGSPGSARTSRSASTASRCCWCC